MTALRNIEAEAMLLGSLLIDNRSIDRIADRLTAADFYEPGHAVIFEQIVRARSSGAVANIVTLKPYLINSEAMAPLGGPGYLAQLTNDNKVLMTTDTCADQIAMLSTRRRLSQALEVVRESALDLELSDAELLDAAEGALTAATGANDGIHQPTGAQCLDELLASFNEPKIGVECKIIKPVDELLGPMRPKQLIIGAGRPGMGKTAFALSYSIGAAMNGHGVLFISLEMSSTELAARMASDMCFDGNGGVPFDAIIGNRVNNDDLRRIVRARAMMADLPFQVVDAGKLTIGRINMMVRRHARRMAAKGQKLELVVVDYLQLVSPDQKRSSNYEAVSEVSRGLKALAKDHGVAVLALAQLSREVEKRVDRRPQLSDLRDSGQIEQDADAVLFLSRQEYYHLQTKPEKEDSPEFYEWDVLYQAMKGEIEFICAKRRNGRIGTAKGRFYGQFQAVRG